MRCFGYPCLLVSVRYEKSKIAVILSGYCRAAMINGLAHIAFYRLSYTLPQTMLSH